MQIVHHTNGRIYAHGEVVSRDATKITSPSAVILYAALAVDGVPPTQSDFAVVAGLQSYDWGYFAPGRSHQYVNGVLSAVEGFEPPAAPAPPAPLLKWDALDFKRRFTQAERINIHTLAQTNMQALDFLDLLNTAAATGTMIHSNDPDVIAGLQAFEAAQLLAPGRAAEILGG